MRMLRLSGNLTRDLASRLRHVGFSINKGSWHVAGMHLLGAVGGGMGGEGGEATAELLSVEGNESIKRPSMASFASLARTRVSMNWGHR